MRLIHSRQIVALGPWSELLGCHADVRGVEEQEAAVHEYGGFRIEA